MWRTAFSIASPGGAQGRLSVLIFHRVLAEPDPLFPDEIHAARFDQICSWAARWFHVLPLDEAVRRRAAGSLPKRALCISFDDGYADNHRVAVPILQRHRLSATFFISTGYLDGGRMWNDSVVESVRCTTQETLDLSALAAGLSCYSLSSMPARRQAIHDILAVVKYLVPARRLEVVSEIAALANVVLPDDLMLRSDEVMAMRSAGFVIGAHTVNHPILAKLSACDVAREVQESRQYLERLLHEPVRLFAYPNGKPGTDYDAQTADIVRGLGFDAAFTTAWGAARPSTDAFQLPRFTPWDADHRRFGVRLLRNLQLPA